MEQINGYLKLINGQSNLIDKLYKENEAMRELLCEEHRKYSLMVKSREKYKYLYESLQNKLKELL